MKPLTKRPLRGVDEDRQILLRKSERAIFLSSGLDGQRGMVLDLTLDSKVVQRADTLQERREVFYQVVLNAHRHGM